MAEKTNVQDSAEKATASALNSMTELQKSGFGSVSWMGAAWFENMSDIGSEMMNFMAARVKEDVKTQHEILHCKDATEMRKIQTEFIRKAVDQYTAETGKLVEMGSEFMTSAQAKKTN